MKSPIISTDWLSKRILDPTIKIIEVSSKMKPEAPYFSGHIPGAINFFWKSLCWNDTDRQLVTPSELSERLGKVGISEKDRIVLYGEPVQYGTYALWALTMAGHEQLFVLDGSRKKWELEGRPFTNEIPEVLPTTYVPRQGNVSMRLGRDNIFGQS